MTRLVLVALSVTACAGEVIPPRDDTDDDDSSCDLSVRLTIDMTYEGTVERDGAPAAGAEVVLIDNATALDPDFATSFGTAITDDDGRFTLEATSFTWYPNCKLGRTDYEVRATLENLAATDDVNFETFRALEDEETSVTLSAPLDLRPE